VARKRVEPPPSRPATQAEADRAALFAGVREDPDDDAPRLVLADWLDEHGSDEDDRAHAELIRVQCEAVRRAAELIDPGRPGPIHALLRMVGYHNNTLPHDFFELTRPDGRLAALKEREEELTRPWQEQHRIAVMAWPFKRRDLVALSAPEGRVTWWHRGFADLHLRDAPFRSRDMAALAAGPWGPRVDQMALNVSPSTVGQIARSPMLAHLSGLYATGQVFRGDELKALLASPHLAGLRRLDLGLYAGLDKIQAIITAPQHARFTHLYLYDHRLDAGGYRRFAAADLSSLKSLYLGGTPEMGAAGTKALAGAAFLGHLQELMLTNNGLGTEGMEALAAGPHFRCPARLRVGHNALGITGLRALLAAPGLEDVVALELREDDLDDAAVAELAASPRLSGLVTLDLGNNPKIGPAGAEAVAASPHLARLASLKLGGALGGAIGEVGARALVRSPHLRRLQLAFQRAGVSEDTLAALRERYLMEHDRPPHRKAP
jgi:uncharacterized protein (TIGR02996 family)